MPIANMGRVVLASRSPRRLDLLREMGIEPLVVAADIDETPQDGETPIEYVERLATAKAAVVANLESVADLSSVVIAADTTVDLDGEIFGQPVDIYDARQMLERLSGRGHRVHTGVCVLQPTTGISITEVATSEVLFEVLSDELLDWYLGTCEWQGKAGSYAVQGLGRALVAKVTGSQSNVIGLPVELTKRLLAIVNQGQK